MVGRCRTQPNRGVAVGPGSASVLWSVSLGGGSAAPPAIGADGTIYVAGRQDGLLHAVSSDGLKRWSVRFSSATSLNASVTPAIGADGTVYVGAYDGKVVAVTPAGGVAWTHDVGSPIRGSALIADDRTIIVGTGAGKLVALAPDGSERATFSASAPISGANLAIGEHGTIFFTAADGRSYGVTADGMRVWTAKIGGFGTAEQFPIIADVDTVIFSDPWTGALRNYAESGTGFSYRWESPVFFVLVGLALTGNGTLWSANRDGELVEWYVVDGQKTGKSRSGLKKPSWAPTIDGDGNMYLASEDTLYAMDRSATAKWQMVPTGQWLGGASIGASGVLYLSSNDRLLAIGP